jgi:hypothetical protein
MNLGLETSKLEIESKELSIKSATRKITTAEDTRYSFTLRDDFSSLSNYDNSTHLYGITVGVDIKNTYDQTLHVKGCLFNTFFARLPSVEAGPKHVLEIEGPPSAIQEPEKGPITWELMKSHPFKSYSGADTFFFRNRDTIHPKPIFWWEIALEIFHQETRCRTASITSFVQSLSTWWASVWIWTSKVSDGAGRAMETFCRPPNFLKLTRSA